MTDKIYEKHNTMPYPDPETRDQAARNAIAVMKMADEYAHDGGRFVMAEKITRMAEGWAAIAAVLRDVDYDDVKEELITDGGVPENWDGSMYPVSFDVTEDERQQILDQRSGIDVILSAERERARRGTAGPVPGETYDDKTLEKVRAGLSKAIAGLSYKSATDIISAIQNEGILFRDRARTFSGEKATRTVVDEESDEHDGPTISAGQVLRDLLVGAGIKRPGVILRKMNQEGIEVRYVNADGTLQMWDTQPRPKDAAVNMAVTPKEQETLWALRGGRAAVTLIGGGYANRDGLNVAPGVPEPGAYDVMPGAVVSAATVQLMRAAIGYMLDMLPIADGEVVLPAHQVERNVRATFNLSLEQDGRLTVYDTRTPDPDAG